MRLHQHLAVLGENLLAPYNDIITIFRLIIIPFVTIIITYTLFLTKA